MKQWLLYVLLVLLWIPESGTAQKDTIMAGVSADVVVTGTLKEVKRSESPVAVELYSAAFFRKNPTSNIFDAMQQINGVRPQLNCNVCNTGDIRINGLPGAYTMVLIDGMPIVSSLSTVYGLSGIPNAFVERVEIVKGPASSLYGSEAVGGLINIITKKPTVSNAISAEVMGTSWGELSADIGFTNSVGKKTTVLTGLHYFGFNNRIDNNNDGFTDISLQKRFSVFQKWNFQRNRSRIASMAGRYFYENRWGGEMNWNEKFRGTDIVYGESIYTHRLELIGNYQLPIKEKFLFSFSYNQHEQDSRYGTSSYIAKQRIAFAQLTWDKTIFKHDFLVGAAFRYTFYNDNTPATGSPAPDKWGTNPQKISLPGIFIQDEIRFSDKHKLLLGLRYDYNSAHGNIITPRIAYKYTINENNFLRLNAGTGFRVVNLFTEDHAALTGARSVVIKEDLKPERSYNVNLNYTKRWFGKDGSTINLDITSFYTYFNNRIIGDFDTDPNKIIYENLHGFAESKGVSVNTDYRTAGRWKLGAGATYMDVSVVENGMKEQQILTERFTGTWTISYTLPVQHMDIDYTGNIYSPMRLPLLGVLDPRPGMSPWWSIQNIQVRWHRKKGIEIYGGVKNLLNYLPGSGLPFLIARTHDPFDKQVQYGANGQILATPDNPYALSFDPNYVYAPNQGIRFFVGLRVTLR
jgi:outer membrane receptor for ferrienterochelin and colicins